MTLNINSQEAWNYLQKSIFLESRVSQLFFEIASILMSKRLFRSFQVMDDDLFIHRKDRIDNDIHLFLELFDGTFLQIRAYTRYMLQINTPENQIFLTGYRKDVVSHYGWVHSFEQKSYSWNAQEIVTSIILQNPDLFPLNHLWQTVSQSTMELVKSDLR